MEKNLYIDASHPNETRVVLKSDSNIEDYEYEGLKNNLIKNNIYLGKVSRIEPSLQAAFVDFGRDRHGFLSFNDIQSDYYQIPKSDLEIIKKEEEKAREELSKKVEAKEEEDIAEGKLEVDDPIEKSENNNKENLEEKEKKNDNRFRFKRYKIQEVIKPNQVILIQVLKDERGQKGAALTTFISIAGKYIVLMPNTPKGGGISRKIFNPAERKKIRSILNEIEIPKEMGLIVRTAGSNKTKNEINHDLDTQIKIKMQLRKNIKAGRNRNKLISLILFLFLFSSKSYSSTALEGSQTYIKILDKISSKNTLLKLKNTNEVKYKDLLIKSMKCTNSEFDDNPEIKAYIQVSDLTNNDKDDVYVFNGWMFSSSPSIAPFDHPVYDIWLVGCY